MNAIAREAYAVWRSADMMLSTLSESSDDYWQMRSVRDDMGDLCATLADAPTPGGAQLRPVREAIDRAREAIERAREHHDAADAGARETTLRLMKSARTGARRLLDEQPAGSADRDLLRTALIELEQLDSILADASAAPEAVRRCRALVNDTLFVIERLKSDSHPMSTHTAQPPDNDAPGIGRLLWD